jgi:hypothetical protein
MATRKSQETCRKWLDTCVEEAIGQEIKEKKEWSYQG